MMRYLLLTLGFLVATLQAQKGCTDPQATNFDPAATLNDGSCVYPSTLIAPKVLIQKLSDTLNETSGLAKLGGQWYSHNDGGNPAHIYRIANNGSIAQTVYIGNSPNTDWEDLTFSDSFGFIGDFGNNSGNRTDLKILKFNPFQWSQSQAIDTLSAEVIAFNYADQTQFTASSNATSFDCEAMIYWHDSLHIFTKNWSNGYTKRYIIPAAPGNYTVWPRDSLYLGFLVTGAAVHNNRIALVGYDKSGNGFLQLLWDFPDQQPWKGNKRTISLGSFIATGQIESVAFADSVTLRATNEKYVVPNRMMEIALFSVWGKTTYNKSPKQSIQFYIAPNPNHEGRLHVSWMQSKQRCINLQLFVINNPEKPVYSATKTIPAGATHLEIPLGDALAAGNYLLRIEGIERGLVIEEKVVYQP